MNPKEFVSASFLYEAEFNILVFVILELVKLLHLLRIQCIFNVRLNQVFTFGLNNKINCKYMLLSSKTTCS